MTWTILRRFPDWEAAHAFAARLVASAGEAASVPDQAGWEEVWRPTGLHIVKVEEHPAGIGIIYYRNGDADVYRGRFLIPRGE